jgi:DNA polymerase III delta subunit
VAPCKVVAQSDMKIILLHGDDTAKSYERLKKFVETAKKRSWEVSYLDESKQSFQENLSSNSLFGAERFLILRDIRILGKKELDWLKKKAFDLSGNLIIFNEGVVNQTLLKSLPKDTKVEEFKLPKLIWNFLDSIRPGSGISSVVQFHKIIEGEAPEFVFSLIAKRFRDLYWVKTDPESLSLASWQVSKLKSQSKDFKPEELKEIIEKLAEIDINVKKGKADLVSSLDLFMLKQLE